MNSNQANLRLCPHAHIWAKHSNAGGDNVMHLSFLEIPTGVLPHQPDDEIFRKHLAVVRVAAEICIDVLPPAEKAR